MSINRGNQQRHRTAAQRAHVQAEALERFRRRRAALRAKKEKPEPFGRAVSMTAVMAPMIKTVDPETRALIDVALAARGLGAEIGGIEDQVRERYRENALRLAEMRSKEMSDA